MKRLILIIIMLLIHTQSGAMAESERDYYAILGVAKTATSGEITKAFKRRALELQPDKIAEKLQSLVNKGEIKQQDMDKKIAYLNKKFKSVSKAYETLNDPAKRAAYDARTWYTPKSAEAPKPQAAIPDNYPQYLRKLKSILHIHAWTPGLVIHADDIDILYNHYIREILDYLLRYSIFERTKYLDLIEIAFAVKPLEDLGATVTEKLHALNSKLEQPITLNGTTKEKLSKIARIQSGYKYEDALRKISMGGNIYLGYDFLDPARLFSDDTTIFLVLYVDEEARNAFIKSYLILGEAFLHRDQRRDVNTIIAMLDTFFSDLGINFPVDDVLIDRIDDLKESISEQEEKEKEEEE